MVQVLKLVKTAGKLFVTLSIIFGFFIINGYVPRPRIQKFQIWKIQYGDGYSSSPKKSHDRKYILIWSNQDNQFDILKEKQIAFKENKCAFTNCYVTADKNLLEFDYRNFDAILINGKTVSEDNNAALPQHRLPHQMFIFATKESADNYPICNAKFDNYFNLTWTYRLDSDAKWTYFSIYDDNKDEEIGPKRDMKWSPVYYPIEEKEILLKKQHAAAWFASNCYTNSKRELLVNNIKANLNRYGLNLHTVGSCGTSECPIEEEKCVKRLETYYFYLAFENSIAEDYVSEKVLKAMFHGCVPVVFGGANYSRFLPPNSYLDAGQLGAENTAALIAYLIQNRTAYLDYFRWQNNYHYRPSTRAVCNLCEVLNKDVGKIYLNFREWWNPLYRFACEGRRHKRSVRNPRSVLNAVWKRLTTLPEPPFWYFRTRTTMNPRKVVFI